MTVMDGVERLPVVGVMGSGSEAHEDRTAPLGHWLAEAGFHLLTGAGGGVMASVSRAFSGVIARRGLVIGVVPGRVDDAGHSSFPGYPNPWVEIPIVTHLPLSGDEGTSPMSRNHINVLSARVIVALPGGAGTSSEVRLALRYGRPVVAHVGGRGEIPGLPDDVTVAPELDEVRAFVLGHV